MAATEDNVKVLEAAHAYANEALVVDLFQHLTGFLVLNQPKDPKAAVIAEIARCQAAVAETGNLPDVSSEARPTEESAHAYIEKHKLPALFEELCAAALYHKPEDAFDFISQELQRVAKEEAAGHRKPTFFTEDDLKGMFSLFDPTGRGVISAAQVQTGLKNLGLEDTQLTPEEVAASTSAGFSCEQFSSIAMARIQASKSV